MNGGDENGQLYFQGIILSWPAGSWVQTLLPGSPRPSPSPSVTRHPGWPSALSRSGGSRPPLHLPGLTLNPGPSCSTKTLCPPPPPPAPAEAQSGGTCILRGGERAGHLPTTSQEHRVLTPMSGSHLGLPPLRTQPRSALGHV